MDLIFKFYNIIRGGDPWELHFYGTNVEDINILKHYQDCECRLVVNGTEWKISYGYDSYRPSHPFFVKGSTNELHHNPTDRRMKYWNIADNQAYNKHEFNEQLRQAYPDIEQEVIINGAFDPDNMVFTI